MLRWKYKNQNQLLIVLLVVGFFIGVIYENIVSKSQGATMELFLKSNLQRYLQIDVIAEKYFWYVIKDRVFCLLLICVLSCVKWKKLFVSLCMILIGFFTGTFCVASVLHLGIKGILLCIAGFFPQMLFYGFSYGMLFIYWFHYPARQWNRVKTLFIFILFMIGLVLEIYVNPLVVKYIIRIL